MILHLRGPGLLFPITIIILLCIPILQGRSFRIDHERLRRLATSSSQLRTVEHQYLDHRSPQNQDHAAGQVHSAAAKTQFKRSTSGCNLERLNSMLSSCERAAAPVPATEASQRDPAPLFCGAGCSQQVMHYASECSSNQKFLVTVNGACKLGGVNLTLECVYAVVMVQIGFTFCSKSQQGVDFTHEEVQYLFNKSEQYVEETCCSLQTSYIDNPSHEVIIDTSGRVTTDPPLEPPWLNTNLSDYEAIVEVTRSDLCLKPPTTTVTNSVPSTTTATTAAAVTTSQSESTVIRIEINSVVSGVHRISLLSSVLRVICACLLALSLAILH